MYTVGFPTMDQKCCFRIRGWLNLLCEPGDKEGQMYMHWKKSACKWIQNHVVQRPIVVGLISTTSLLFSLCYLCSLFLNLASTPFCHLWYLIEHFICLHFILS